MKIRISRRNIEYAWHFFVLLILSGFFIPLWRLETQGIVDPIDGDPLLRIMYVVIYGISLLFLLNKVRYVVTIINKTPLLWLIIFLVLASSIWSADTLLTLRRSLLALLVTLYGLLLYLRFNFKEFIILFANVFIVCVLGSLLMVFLFPEWGVMGEPHLGAWRGVFPHKNNLGLISIFSVLSFGYYWINVRGLKRILLSFLILISIILLVFSKSTTSILVFMLILISILTLIVIRKFRNEWYILFVFFIGFSLFSFLFISQKLEDILAIVGKDITFSGRVPLWEAVLPIGFQKFITGYGYRSFWLGFEGPSSEVWEVITWHPGHSHNGYIDLFVELGIIGLILVLCLLLRILILSLKKFVSYQNDDSLFNFAFIILFWIFLFFLNLSETTILQSGIYKSIFWIALVYIYLYLEIREKRDKEIETKNPNNYI